MKSKKIILPIMMVLVFSMALSLQAEEEKNFYGQFTFGYRTVSTEGAMTKYKEDINLDDGMRLFNLNLHFTPTGTLKKFVDQIDLAVYNFGGDPFETFTLSVKKFGLYEFKYNRKKAEYFYNDMYDVGGGHLYDQHSFDFVRVMDSGSFKYSLGKIGLFHVNFDRYTKEGDSITTFDINRIEFEFDNPIKEEYNSGAVGIDLFLGRYTFGYEYQVSDYSTSNSLFLPGLADGGAGARYPSELALFFINQPYELDTQTHVVKTTLRPFNFVMLSGSAQLMNQDMSLHYTEQQQGKDYLGYCFEYGDSGTAAFKRKIGNYDLDLTILVFRNVALIGAVRYDEFEQAGEFTTQVLGEMAQPYGFNTLGIEAGLQYQVSSTFGLTVGYRKETRELTNLMTVTYGDESERTGLFGNVKVNLSRAFSLTLDYQSGSYEHPYTMISPSSLNRFRGTARLGLGDFKASAVLMTSKITNDVLGLPGWDSTNNQINLRAGYYGKGATLSAGYSNIKVEHSGNRDIGYPPGWGGAASSFDWAIDFEGKSNLIDAHASFKLSENMSAGAYFNNYTNRGFWKIDRTMFKGYLEYVMTTGLVFQIALRSVNFKETAKDNDYKANIIEFSFGYRWK